MHAEGPELVEYEEHETCSDLWRDMRPERRIISVGFVACFQARQRVVLEERVLMVLSRGESEFEVHICLTDEGEWEGRIIEYTMTRLMPTLHLRHSWVTLETALQGVTRRWQRLFPDEDAPDFLEAVNEVPPRR